jgi:predicted metal-dependent phosphoesterase TrpH
MKGRVQDILHRELLRVDLHLHSSASPDCSSDPKRVLQRCRLLGLSPVFLTDHDTISGAASLQSAGIDRIVVGEEVSTTEGEVIGLFLQKEVRSGLNARDTALEIKAQGGLLYLEHPYDRSRRCLSEVAIEAIADLVDIVEVFNGRSDEHSNHRADELCGILGAAPGAGSDGHSLAEIGSVYIEMEDFDDAEDFLAKLRSAKITKGRSRFRLLAEANLKTLLGRP